MTRVKKALRESGPSFVAGVIAGKVAEAVALEGFSHMQLSHRNVAYHPLLAKLSRHALVTAGMSPNRFAAGHRLHHHRVDAQPESTVGAVRHVLATGFADDIDLTTNRALLEFPGYTFDDDPLIIETPDGLGYRDDPRSEKLVARGGIYSAIPMLCVVALGTAINKGLSRKNPAGKAIAAVVGFQAGFASQATFTSFAEARAGYTGGKLDTDNVGNILSRRVAQHQEHHNAPHILDAGSRRRHRVTFRALSKIGLSQDVPQPESIERQT